jgi:hypothetical protein
MKKIANVASLLDRRGNIKEAKSIQLMLLKFAEDESPQYGESDPPPFMQGLKPGFVDFDILDNLRNYIYNIVADEQNNDKMYQENVEDILMFFDTITKIIDLFNEFQNIADQNQYVHDVKEVFSEILKRLKIFEQYFGIRFTNEQREIIVEAMQFIVEKLKELALDD